MKISEMNWMKVEKMAKKDDRAVLPLGSIEQHGYLSLATDFILAEKVATDAAEPLDIPVFPALPYGFTPRFKAYPGSVTLKLETYIAVVRDILDGIVNAGFRRIVIVNGHGGNEPIRYLAYEYVAAHPEVRIKFYNWWIGPKTWGKIQDIDPDADHASWMENFPWTRLEGVKLPAKKKPMVDNARASLLDPKSLRKFLGDGSFGGLYQKADQEMLDVWKIAVEETRAQMTGKW